MMAVMFLAVLQVFFLVTSHKRTCDVNIPCGCIVGWGGCLGWGIRAPLYEGALTQKKDSISQPNKKEKICVISEARNQSVQSVCNAQYLLLCDCMHIDKHARTHTHTLKKEKSNATQFRFFFLRLLTKYAKEHHLDFFLKLLL